MSENNKSNVPTENKEESKKIPFSNAVQRAKENEIKIDEAKNKVLNSMIDGSHIAVKRIQKAISDWSSGTFLYEENIVDMPSFAVDFLTQSLVAEGYFVRQTTKEVDIDQWAHSTAHQPFLVISFNPIY